MRIGLTLAAALLTSACAIVDTGEIDYRRAEPLKPMTKADLDALPPECSPEEKRTSGFGSTRPSGSRPATTTTVDRVQCRAVLGAKLFRKHLGRGHGIKKDEVYSISLEHGLIAFMTEPAFSTRRLISLKDARRKTGEIVILANAFEYPAGNTAESASAVGAPGFADFSDFSKVKVIYYSPDVELGQDLNFSNIPLQPPTVYNGNPIGIQIIVMELDRVSPQMKSLIMRLADLGRTSNILPNGAAANLLLELGTSMVSQDNDDTIFEYRFVLDPATVDASSVSAPFEAGRYVLRRLDERRSDMIWRNLEIDHNTGKLMIVSPPSSVSQAFEEDTYFTINIKRLPKGSEGIYAFKSFESLGKDIAAASTSASTLVPVGEQIESRVHELRREALGKGLAQSWLDASEKFKRLARYRGQCESGGHEEGEALVAARSAAMRYARAFEAAKEATVPVKGADGKLLEEDLFGVDEQQEAIDLIAPFFVRSDGKLPDEFKSPEAFGAAFLGTNQEAFIGAMDGAITDYWAAQVCKTV